MKCGFYMIGQKKEIDYSKAFAPNPGIGGTQYLFLTIPYYLQKKYKDIEVTYICEYPESMPVDLKSYYAKNFEECLEVCKRENIEILIIRGPYITSQHSQLIDKYKQKTIVWSHNSENYSSVKLMEKTKYIIKNVCVSKEQFDHLLDTNLYSKSCYIYNALDFKDYIVSNEINSKKICYIGNLLPDSGYINLLRSWIKVKKAGCDGKLYIIGNNKLYSDDLLSKYRRKFAKQKKVEERVLNSEITKDSVIFLGLQRGVDKIKEMGSSYIGIANITPTGETFGLGVVEFEALGVPVVSLNKYGIRDTVLDGSTGILASNKKDLSKEILKLYNNKLVHDKLKNNGENFVRDKFDINTVVDEWHRLLSNPLEYCNELNCTERFSYDCKWFIYINAKFRKVFRFAPNHLYYVSLFKRLKKVLDLL